MCHFCHCFHEFVTKVIIFCSYFQQFSELMEGRTAEFLENISFRLGNPTIASYRPLYTGFGKASSVMFLVFASCFMFGGYLYRVQTKTCKFS